MAKKNILIAILLTVTPALLVSCSTQSERTVRPQSLVVKAEKSTKKKAMTWILNNVYYGIAGKQYFRFGRDTKTDAYIGDTDINEKADLLCIEKKANLPIPIGLSKRETTEGGAFRNSWSGRQAIIIPNVSGTSLASKKIADKLCSSSGNRFGLNDLRMAEFHDGGKEHEAGWSYWVDGTKGNISIESKKKDFYQRRFWVSINDTSANPWP